MGILDFILPKKKAQDPIADPDAHKGQTLISAHGQFDYSEYNPDLTLEAAIGTAREPGEYDKAWNDPVVFDAWNTAVESLHSIEYEIEIHESGNPAILDFAKKLWFEMCARLPAEISEDMLQAVRVGVAPFYINTKFEDGFYWLDDLEYRPLRTFYLPSVRAMDGWVVGQQEIIDENAHTQLVDFEPGELLWAIYGDKTSLFGRPIFRRIWFWWDLKVKAAILGRRKMENGAIGTAKARKREDYKGKVTQSQIDELLDKLEEHRTHATGAIWTPDFADIEYWFSEDKADSISLDFWQQCNVEISQGFATGWKQLGLTGEGNRSVGEVGERDTQQSKLTLTHWLVSIYQVVMNYYVDLNYGQQKYYPYFVATLKKPINIRRDEELDTDGDGDGEGGDGQPITELKPGKPDTQKGKFADFVKLPPKPGGQDKRMGPDGETPIGPVEGKFPVEMVAMQFDASESGLEALGIRIRRSMAIDILTQIGTAWQTKPEFQKKLDRSRVSARVRSAARREFQKELERMHDLGRTTADIEFETQRAQTSPARFAEDLDPAFADSKASQAASQAESEIKIQLMEMMFDLEVLDASGDIDIDEFMRILQEEMNTPGRIRKTGAAEFARAATATVFNRAREARVMEIIEREEIEIPDTWYTVVLELATKSPDGNVCSECREAWNQHGEGRGTPLRIGTPEYEFFMPPNSECLGGGRCRCFYTHEYK